MFNFIHISCDQNGEGDQKIIFDHKGEKGVCTPLKIEHKIYEQPLNPSIADGSFHNFTLSVFPICNFLFTMECNNGSCLLKLKN